MMLILQIAGGIILAIFCLAVIAEMLYPTETLERRLEKQRRWNQKY